MLAKERETKLKKMAPNVLNGMGDAKSPMPEFYVLEDMGAKTPFIREDFSHVFQQSVTLTAKMWHGGNGSSLSGAGENWKWSSWRLPPEYAPLLVGFCCSIAVILLAISAAIVWRCILLPSRKKGKNSYEEMIPHSGNNGSQSVSRDTAVYALRNGRWGYHSHLVERSSMYRSATLEIMPMYNCICEDVASKKKCRRPISQSLGSDLKNQHLLVNAVSPFQLEEHLCFDNEEMQMAARERSKSTPSLEDVYAKVNFSKKRKNRMRKDEAAIIAMSKSRSGHENNSMALAGTAVVVYNERTAL